MSRFQLGDIVVGTEEANKMYTLTAPKNDFVGKVVEIMSDTRMKVEIIQGKRDFGSVHGVNQECFELHDSELALIQRLAREGA